MGSLAVREHMQHPSLVAVMPRFPNMTKEFGVKVKKYIWQAWVTKLPETRGQHMFHMSLPLN